MAPRPPAKRALQKRAEIVDRGVERAGRIDSHRERRRRKDAAVERPHVGLGQVRPHLRRRLEAALAHAERVEHGAFDRPGERFAVHALDHVADGGQRRVRVLGARSRWIDQRGSIEALDGGGQRRLGGIEVAPDRRLAHQARAVRHQVAQGDRPAERIARTEVRQIAGDLGVEIDLAALDQLHQRDVGEELGHRSDAVDRVGGGLHSSFGVGEAEAAGPDRPLVVDQRDRQRRQLLVLHLMLDEPLEDRDGGVVVGRGSGRARWRRQGCCGRECGNDHRREPRTPSGGHGAGRAVCRGRRYFFGSQCRHRPDRFVRGPRGSS